MKRTKQLTRKTPLRSKRAKPRRRPRDMHDQEFLDWVHRQPCCARELGGCRGRIEADHTGRDRGIGQKAHDRTTIPLCHHHHMCRTSFSGVFRTWDQAKMREWLVISSRICRQTYELSHG